MSVYEIITIIISGLTLIATVAISFVLYHLNNKHREEEIRLKNEQLAKAFIIDNNDINNYVPICVIASALNRHKNHHRKLYNEFNKLSDEVQKEVIKQCNYNIDLVKETDWVRKSINYVNNFLNDNNLGNGRNNYLYENAKYLHYAIRRLADHEYDDRRFDAKYKNPFPNQKIGFINNNCVEYLIDFDTYCDNYMYYVVNNKRKDFIIYKSEKIALKPLNYLEKVESLSSSFTSDEDVCYWVLDFVNFFAIYIINTLPDGYPDDYMNDARLETFEDMYYEVMVSLYLVHKLVICKEETK